MTTTFQTLQDALRTDDGIAMEDEYRAEMKAQSEGEIYAENAWLRAAESDPEALYWTEWEDAQGWS